jgi:hypothetical protein
VAEGGGVTDGVGVFEGDAKGQQKYSVTSAILGVKMHPLPFKLQAAPLTVIPFGITFVQI